MAFGLLCPARLSEPKKVFIDLEFLGRDVAEDDVLVEREINGVVKKGVICLAPGEKAGHYHIENFNDRSVVQQTEVTNNKLSLTKDQVEQRHALYKSKMSAEAGWAGKGVRVRQRQYKLVVRSNMSHKS